MTRFYCNNCKKTISKGVFRYSMDVYKRALCLQCQDYQQRYEDITSGKLVVEYEKITHCLDCGKDLSGETVHGAYCSTCLEKFDQRNQKNPFSPEGKRKKSKFLKDIDSDHL